MRAHAHWNHTPQLLCVSWQAERSWEEKQTDRQRLIIHEDYRGLWHPMNRTPIERGYKAFITISFSGDAWNIKKFHTAVWLFWLLILFSGGMLLKVCQVTVTNAVQVLDSSYSWLYFYKCFCFAGERVFGANNEDLAVSLSMLMVTSVPEKAKS